MLVFDQLKKNDAQLQLLALLLCSGLAVLLAGLWWVQIVNATRYRESVETQSFRTVRLAAVRGKILDRNGIALAENRPAYNINLYLDDLSSAFKKEFKATRPTKILTNDLPFWKDWLGFSPVKTQFVRLKDDQYERAARFRVVSAVAANVGNALQTPLTLNPTNFDRHYANARAMPFCLASNLSLQHVARFEEQAANNPGLDLEILSRRFYPHSNVATHVIGYVRPDPSSAAGEDAFFDFWMPDYRGLVGIEGGFDHQLRGRAGIKSVQVNSLLYRQAENIWEPAEPGHNVVLTLDLEVQRATEAALRSKIGPSGRGAVVVMDVRSGDILALASYPTFSPNQFAHGISRRDYTQIQEITAEKNRATAENYQAGSVFKTIVALAALETPRSGFNPNAEYEVQPHPTRAGHGIIYVGRQPVQDTAPPGLYNLRRAIVRSSNAYFIDTGLRPGVFERVVELGRRLHFGERFDTNSVPLRQQTPGHFPTVEKARSLPAGEKANICIGQGAMDVTPLQVAVMISAIANGGNVLKPRMVDRLESSDPASIEPPTIYPRGVIRDQLGVSKRSFTILHEAMLSETEDPEGTGKAVKGCGFRVCGKTGTAELDTLRADGGKKNTTWFGSFAPYEAPRYAVIIMVENGASGGGTCAPIAHDVYVALKSFEDRQATKTMTVSTK